jgi:serine/threonine protein kinase
VDSDRVIADRYRLDEPIGAGGMGVVWRATDLTLGRTVAAKHGEEIRREARVGAGLLHPNVVAVFDVVAEGDDRWLVMEYLPSRSLAEVLGADGPLSHRDAAWIGAQIASALAAMHGMGMVHRDITPGNVLVTDGRVAKLTDFGIAVWESVTQTGDIKISGTPGFVATEVVRGHPATAASDMFSLGATLSAAVEGHSGDESDGGSAGDGPLAPAIAALTHPDPAKRPTAEQARQLLLDVADGTGSWWRPRRRVLAGVAAVAVVAVAVWLLVPQRGAPTPVAPTPTAAAAPPSLLGDPRTADPCSLTDATALSRFGAAELVDDYGNFNRCDVLVHLGADHDDYVDVRLTLDSGQDAEPSASTPIEHSGPIGIQRLPEQDGDCQRTLLLPSDHQVVIDADHEQGDEHADVCAMADALTSSALIVLDRGSIPRRVPALPAASLASQDACALLGGTSLTGVLGTPRPREEPGFAHWECDWNGSGDNEVSVIFDRNEPLVPGDDGQQIELSGRHAFVRGTDYSDTTCEVAVVDRTYDDPAGDPTSDVVEVIVDGDQPPRQLCTPARTVATAVAAHLPAP